MSNLLLFPQWCFNLYILNILHELYMLPETVRSVTIMIKELLMQIQSL